MEDIYSQLLDEGISYSTWKPPWVEMENMLKEIGNF